MEGTIITNNPMVRDAYANRYNTEFRAASYEALLKEVRNLVHLGARLLTHPLYGSVKPHETPYRSVLLETGTGRTDAESVALIENALLSAKKFRNKAASYDADLLKDCQTVDLSLFESAMYAMEQRPI